MHPPREASGGGRLIIDKSKPATADFQAEAENLFSMLSGGLPKRPLDLIPDPSLSSNLPNRPWDQASRPWRVVIRRAQLM